MTTSRGLPPLATNAASRLLAPDTLVQTSAYTMHTYRAGEPMRIALRVFVRDTSTSTLRARVLPLDACPFVLRLFRSDDPSATPVWRSDRAAELLRCPTLQTYGSRGTDVTAMWDVPAILGDSLRSGKYSYRYAVRTGDGRVFEFTNGAAYLTADRTPASGDLSTIEWAARSEVVGEGPRQLKTVVTLRNTGARSVALNYGACNVLVRLYRVPDRRGAPAWRSEYRKPPGSSSLYGCIMPLYVSLIPPGDSLVFPVSFPMYEVLGDSLAAGRYYVAAEVSVAGGDASETIGGARLVQTVSAGAVDLTREPDRLPSSRVVDGLSYTATTRIVRGAGGADTIRTLVLVINTSTVRREADVARDCPVIAYAHRTAALRDSVPLQPPAPYPNTRCFLNPYHFALEPGQSWVFAHDVPMTTARAALIAGRYWFTAWLPAGPFIILAAGDVEIR